jgi:hypothetical protein
MLCQDLRLCPLSFELRIVAQEMGRPISWADFAEETNSSQRLKYQKRVTKAMATLKDAKKLVECTRTVKQEGDSKCEEDSKLTGLGATDVPGSVQKSGR